MKKKKKETNTTYQEYFIGGFFIFVFLLTAPLHYPFVLIGMLFEKLYDYRFKVK